MIEKIAVEEGIQLASLNNPSMLRLHRLKRISF
jgi:hypothetical protein